MSQSSVDNNSSTRAPLLTLQDSRHSSLSDYQKPCSIITLSQSSCRLRISAFLLLEFGFLALAIRCAMTPLVLGSTLQSHPTEVKSAFTILFILWQALALVSVGDILNYVFSSEWSHHLLQKGTLVLGKTDRISTLMAGRWDWAQYCFDPNASSLFRTAFLTSAVFMALAGLAPGVVSIGVAFIAQPMSLPIGNVTIVSEPILGPYIRATYIVRQEQLQSVQFGYRNANNWIVGWPPMGLPTNGSGPIEYFSDVVKYNHSCTWNTPVWDNSTQSYIAGGVSWVGFPLTEPARRPDVTSRK